MTKTEKQNPKKNTPDPAAVAAVEAAEIVSRARLAAEKSVFVEKTKAEKAVASARDDRDSAAVEMKKLREQIATLHEEAGAALEKGDDKTFTVKVEQREAAKAKLNAVENAGPNAGVQSAQAALAAVEAKQRETFRELLTAALNDAMGEVERDAKALVRKTRKALDLREVLKAAGAKVGPGSRLQIAGEALHYAPGKELEFLSTRDALQPPGAPKIGKETAEETYARIFSGSAPVGTVEMPAVSLADPSPAEFEALLDPSGAAVPLDE